MRYCKHTHEIYREVILEHTLDKANIHASLGVLTPGCGIKLRSKP
jgi:hypothetical protein